MLVDILHRVLHRRELRRIFHEIPIESKQIDVFFFIDAIEEMIVLTRITSKFDSVFFLFDTRHPDLS